MSLTTYVVLTVIGLVILVASDLLDDVVGNITNWFDGGDGDGEGVGWISIKLLTVFISGFGATGALAILKGVKGDFVWIMGLLFGAMLAAVVRYIMVLLATQQGSSHFATSELKGKVGRVLIDIDPGRTGEVSVSHKGVSVAKPARAESPDEAIGYGSQVKVVEVTDDVLIVRRQTTQLQGRSDVDDSAVHQQLA